LNYANTDESRMQEKQHDWQLQQNWQAQSVELNVTED